MKTDKTVTISLTKNQIETLYKLVTSDKLECTNNITMEYNVLSKQVSLVFDITDNAVTSSV
jgi:hypothetical protein